MKHKHELRFTVCWVNWYLTVKSWSIRQTVYSWYWSIINLAPEMKLHKCSCASSEVKLGFKSLQDFSGGRLRTPLHSSSVEQPLCHCANNFRLSRSLTAHRPHKYRRRPKANQTFSNFRKGDGLTVTVFELGGVQQTFLLVMEVQIVAMDTKPQTQSVNSFAN